jgi:hypothetical protein
MRSMQCNVWKEANKTAKDAPADTNSPTEYSRSGRYFLRSPFRVYIMRVSGC